MKKTLSPRGIFERSITEDDILGQCRAILELHRARVFRAIERVPKCYRCGCWLGSSERGTPDLSGYFIESGIPFWVEMKRPKGKKRVLQIERIEMMRSDGRVAFFADGIESMVAGFKEFGIEIRGLPCPK